MKTARVRCYHTTLLPSLKLCFGVYRSELERFLRPYKLIKLAGEHVIPSLINPSILFQYPFVSE